MRQLATVISDKPTKAKHYIDAEFWEENKHLNVLGMCSALC